MYNNPTCKVKNNGFLSEEIQISRGIRQGCALSAIIFILVVEILSLRLKQNQRINGIKVTKSNGDSFENLLSQYADDMSLFLKDEFSIEPCINEVNAFTSVAGPQLNLEKTEGLWLGSTKERQKDCNLYNINWPNKPIRALGIYVGHNDNDCYKLNWLDKLQKIEKSSESWTMRNLTLIGKIYIVKSELLSKIIYTATILPIPNGIIAKLNKILFKFLWGGSEKVQRVIMTSKYDQGGLQMINIESQFQAIKAAWVPRLISAQPLECAWTVLPSKYFSIFGTDNAILKMNEFNISNFPELSLLPAFYQEVVISYNKSKIITIPDHREDILNSVIWGSRFLTYKVRNRTRVLHNIEWQTAGFIKVKDLKFSNFKLDQNFILNKLTNKRNIFNEIKILILAMKPFLHYLDNHTPEPYDNWTTIPLYEINYSPVDIMKKKSKFFYMNLQDQIKAEPYMQNIWTNYFHNAYINFGNCYVSRIAHIKDYKIAQFNFKFYHKILPTDKNLYRWKIQETDKCSICNVVNDEVHMIFKCKSYIGIWNNLLQSQFLNPNLRTICPVELAFFNLNLDNLTLLAISNLCYAIYTEWIDRKRKTIVRDNIAKYSFIKNKLKFKQNIYNYIGWANESKRIGHILSSI